MNIESNHNHRFSECFKIICAITVDGGARHAHCGECDIAAFKVPIFPIDERYSHLYSPS